MRNGGLEEAQAGIKISGRSINNLRYADDTTLMAESKEELKSLLMKVKGEWKSWLKAQHSENEDHGIWSHHFMGNRWGNSGNSVRLYFLRAPLDCKEIQPVHSKGYQSWVFIGRTDAKAETPIFGHLMRRVDSLEKSLMLGGIGGRRRRGQ